ncbi:PREDICTED: uncharacterized protein LOC109587134 [Amphimedon queenslandica]|uniref:Death domain-containing protein n=1 Tax=Amphimedon queenslandica TaxID=400682 RepID=A0AAN0JPJ0_AMPQE|nr:PREDICTED: uncharacterized protein LOC109587134 [Amphimedon queenslandica]|eukprot:XP_019858934.1 PREDICTED: uncharacterized protein LOC109587134 [Amphimedon queenslandica]
MGTILSSPAQAEPPNHLKTNDLAEVLDLLRRHDYSGVSFYNLGLYLGLSSATLDVIKENNKEDVLACLRECLKAWLKKADDGVVKKGGPTVFSLVSALRKLGEKRAAEGMLVMEKHPACKILARISNQSLVSALPKLAPLLHSEMHINEIVCVKKEEDMLLIEIVKAVCNDSNKLEVFARILLQYTATMNIGNTIMREYRKAYYWDESQDNNAKQDEIYLPPCITSKFKSMRVKLSFTFDEVELIIKACPPLTLDKIKNALIYYSEDLKPQVAQCDNAHDILELVRKDCSLDDIEMLKAIQGYIEEFSETELSKCLNEKFSYASPLQCERITIVVDQNTDDCTLHDIRRLAANTFHKLSPQNSRRIKLNVVRDGDSFTITCSFPLILSEQLITAALNNIDVLKENKVKRLTIGYCTVYEVKDTSTATTTEIDEYTSSLSTSSGLSKQLMLSLSVQLINSKEEVTTLNEESMIMKKEAESLKEMLDTKNKMLTASIAESGRLKKIAAETSQLLKEKVSLLTEREEVKVKEILEKQLALFQSEKDEIKQSESGSIVGTIEKHDRASHQEENEDIQSKEAETTETLQSTHKTIQRRMAFEIESLKKELKQKDNEVNEVHAESKKEIELLQEKITTMNWQLIKKEKQIQGNFISFKLKN